MQRAGGAGFVTVEEQQAHRAPLFALVVMLFNDLHPEFPCWKYRVPTVGGSFLCVLQSPAGVIAYHLPTHLWDALDIPCRSDLPPELPEGFMHDRPEKLLNLVRWVQEEGA